MEIMEYGNWTDPASWTTEQWLAVCIFGFIVLAILVMIHRLLTLLNISRRPAYRPNLRPLRRHHYSSGAPVQKENQTESQKENGDDRD
jgi:hypothetical protein